MRTPFAVHGGLGNRGKSSFKLRNVTVALLVDIIANSLHVIASFVSPDIHTVFQGQKSRDRVITNNWDSHQPCKEVSRRDMIHETVFSREVLGGMEVEIRLAIFGWIFLLLIWRARESGYQGLLDKRPAARIEEELIGNAE